MFVVPRVLKLRDLNCILTTQHYYLRPACSRSKRRDCSTIENEKKNDKNFLDIDRHSSFADMMVIGEKVEDLKTFEYLGTRIDGNGKCSNEINRRMATAFFQVKKKNLERKQQTNKQLKIVRSCIFFSIASYGWKGWMITKAYEMNSALMN